MKYYFAAQRVIDQVWVKGSLIQTSTGSDIIRVYTTVDNTFTDHNVMNHTITPLKHGHPGFYREPGNIEEILESGDFYIDGGYNINPDGTVDIDGDIELSLESLKYIPVEFNKVSGTFRLESCFDLISLKGCPRDVDKFIIDNCTSLLTLRHSPLYCNSFRITHPELFIVENDTCDINEIVFIHDDVNDHIIRSYESYENYYKTIHMLWEDLKYVECYELIEKIIHDSGDPEDMLRWIYTKYPEMGAAIIKFGAENNIYVGVHGGDLNNIIRTALNINHKI